MTQPQNDPVTPTSSSPHLPQTSPTNASTKTLHYEDNKAFERAQWAIQHGEKFFGVFTMEVLQKVLHKNDLSGKGKKPDLIRNCCILYASGGCNAADFTSNNTRLTGVPMMP